MMNDPPGFRFSPTKEELLNYYLKNKILDKPWLVDHVISEVNICSWKPKDLPALSKIKSYDLEWYFFALIMWANKKKKTMKRTAVNGFWKVTAPDKTIKDKRGSKIGFKKTLVYHEGKGDNGVRTPWVIHEYHIYLPRKEPTYVLCHLKYKGDYRDISYGGNDSVVSHSDIGREINTVPEAVQMEQPVEDGLNLDELSYPLNVQEDLRTLDAINPNLQQQTLEVQMEQPVEDGLNLDELNYPLNVQEDLRTLDAINPNLQQQTLEVQVVQPVEDGLNLDELSYPLNVQEDLRTLDAINPNLQQQTLEVQVVQPVEDGLNLDELSYPLNVQEDLRPLDAIDPNTFFNYDNPNLLQQTPDVQVEAPVLEGLSLDDQEMPENEQDDLPPPDDFDPNTFLNLPPQTRYADNYWNAYFPNDIRNLDDVIPDQVIVQENRNVYMPKEALSGIIVDCSSDSDDCAESISVMSYQGTSSPHDSVGSSNKHFPRCSSTDSWNDLQISPYVSVSQKMPERQLTQPTVESKKEVKPKSKKKARRARSRENETSMVKTEKNSCFIIKKAIEFYCKKPQHFSLRNMIVGFILLVGFIGYIKP